MNRTLGSHELNAYHINKSQGNLNITVGLLLRTETAIDKGKIYYLVLLILHILITRLFVIHTELFADLVKICLQEFQHMFPQLTTRIPPSALNNNASPRGSQTTLDQLEGHTHPQKQFAPMECPTLPYDHTLECKDMIHAEFDTEKGPLWRVQVIDEDSIQTANLKFGPELEAILEDDSNDWPTRWQHYLRYNTGCVNQVSRYRSYIPRKSIMLLKKPFRSK